MKKSTFLKELLNCELEFHALTPTNLRASKDEAIRKIKDVSFDILLIAVVLTRISRLFTSYSKNTFQSPHFLRYLLVHCAFLQFLIPLKSVSKDTPKSPKRKSENPKVEVRIAPQSL